MPVGSRLKLRVTFATPSSRLSVLAKITAHATVLLVEDVQIAGEFYRDKLGFEVTYFDKNPTHYAYAKRGEMWVHFACFADVAPAPNSVAVPPDMFDIYVYVEDVDALHEELAGRGAEIIGDVTDTEYGCREFRVRDPDGYVLAFGKVLS
jgi:catechol 2,3-dioxygenase-like lactoylglutathione lyase family enzyme